MRLDELADRMGDTITIEWKAFLLRPERAERSLEKFVTYTESWARPASFESSIEFNVWASQDPPPASSVEPHVAAKLIQAQQPDHWHAFHLGLMKAYFTDNRDISNPEVQIAIANTIGADGDALASALVEQGAEMATQVRAEHTEAMEMGVGAAPTVILNQVLPIPGAQDVEAYETWINRILGRS